MEYYIKIIEEQNLSVRQLQHKIKSNEYERLDEATKSKLISREEPCVLYCGDKRIIAKEYKLV